MPVAAGMRRCHKLTHASKARLDMEDGRCMGTWRLAGPFAVNLVTRGLCPRLSDGSGACCSATLLLPTPASNCELMAMQEGS